VFVTVYIGKMRITTKKLKLTWHTSKHNNKTTQQKLTNQK